jgi:hypothetical protein
MLVIQRDFTNTRERAYNPKLDVKDKEDVF